MAIARAQLVDVSLTRWYHCVTRCVRREGSCWEEGDPNRKDWLENRLECGTRGHLCRGRRWFLRHE